MKFYKALLLENTFSETPEPEQVCDLSGYGRWSCCVDNPNAGVDLPDREYKFFNMLEVHKGCAWRDAEDVLDNPKPFSESKVVFRVSRFNPTNGIALGDCAILNRDQIVEVRDLLSSMIEEIDQNSQKENDDV